MRTASDCNSGIWPVLNALLIPLQAQAGFSFIMEAAVGIGYSLHAGQVTVADGTSEMAARIQSRLTNDPGCGRRAAC